MCPLASFESGGTGEETMMRYAFVDFGPEPDQVILGYSSEKH